MKIHRKNVMFSILNILRCWYSTDHNCDTCINGYKFIYNESEKSENTFLEGDIYKKC